MATIVAKPTVIDITAKMKTAQPGDIVQVEGDIGSGGFAGLKFPLDKPPVTLQAGPAGARFVGYKSFKDCANIVVDGINAQSTGFGNLVNLTNCQKMVYQNAEMKGSDTVADIRGDTSGIRAVLSDDITFRNLDIHHLGGGCGSDKCHRLFVLDCKFHDIISDGCQVVDHGDVFVFKGNIGWNHFPAATTHPDFLQFRLSSSATRSASGLLLEDNIWYRGEGKVAQGLFITAKPEFPTIDVFCRRNLMLGSMWNGIRIDSSVNPLVEDNAVIGYKDMPAWIGIADSETGRLYRNIYTALNNQGSKVIDMTTHPNTQVPAIDPVAAPLIKTMWQLLRKSDAPPAQDTSVLDAVKAELAATQVALQTAQQAFTAYRLEVLRAAEAFAKQIAEAGTQRP